MTKFMKFEVISFFVLRVLGYVCGILGAISVLGYAGSYECEIISTAQFWLYELYAFGLIGMSFVLYYLRMWIAEDVIERERQMKLRARHRRAVHIDI